MSEPPPIDFAGETLLILQGLRESKPTQIDLLAQILAAQGGALFGVDLLVMATTQRSFSLIDGFVTLVEAKNMMCAAGLIRLQLDSVMRLHACQLVNDRHAVAGHLMKGEPLSRLRSRSGEKLTDKYLHESATKMYPWFSKIYGATSGFIHLSSPHLYAPMLDGRSAGGTSRFAVTYEGGGRPWTDEERFDAVSAFGEATRALYLLTYSWMITKRGEAAPIADAVGRPGDASV